MNRVGATAITSILDWKTSSNRVKYYYSMASKVLYRHDNFWVYTEAKVLINTKILDELIPINRKEYFDNKNWIVVENDNT